MEGNEKAVGLDLRKDEKQREAALRARETKQLVLAGPVELKQGGQAFIGRFPVFLDRGRPTEAFWGIVAAVIDIQKLYEDSGLLDKKLPIEVALTGKDALGGSGARFYGAAHVTEDNPVSRGAVADRIVADFRRSQGWLERHAPERLDFAISYAHRRRSGRGSDCHRGAAFRATA